MRAWPVMLAILLLMNFNSGGGGINKYEINIALYDSISPSVNLLERCFHYAWYSNGSLYELNVTRIDFGDVMKGNLSNYDALFIGASGRQYFHGLLPGWKERIKEFIRNGGGYVGTCGGANIMAMGYEHPLHLLDFIINIASLGIIDAYVNDDQDEEWQYLWKEGGRSNIPVKTTILSGPMFAGMKERYITYGGGPGMYGMKEATPLAIYAEEPSDVAPLHYWIYKHGLWVPYRNITTDIKGYFSAAERNYGKGKVVVFGNHPEIPPRFNASIEEFFGISIYGIPRYVYAWVGGAQKNWSYNWWILRRSIAYVCALPLPPVEEMYVYLQPPQNNTIEAYTENAVRVDFYIDGEFFVSDDEKPFRMNYNMTGEHVVKAIAYSPNNSYTWDERIISS